jgi:H+-transporting ATPase
VIADGLEKQGFRVLAVAAGAKGSIQIVGFIALSDPPRPDSASLISELKGLGVRTVMVTGDAPETAKIVAHDVGLDGPFVPPGTIPDGSKTRGLCGLCRHTSRRKVQLGQGLPENMATR